MSCKSGLYKPTQKRNIVRTDKDKVLFSIFLCSDLLLFFLFLTGTSFKILVPFLSQFAAFALPKAKWFNIWAGIVNGKSNTMVSM